MYEITLETLFIQMREGLTEAWMKPRITWAGATFEDKHQVKAAVLKLPNKYDVPPPPPPPPSTQAQASALSSSGAKPKSKPSLPKDEKETPNVHCKILHLEGTKQNNLKSKTLATYAQRDLHKVMTEVKKNY